MPEKRRGLGRGLGALIPSSAEQQGDTASSTSTRVAERGRPVDLFFPSSGSKSVGDQGASGSEEERSSRSTGRSSINKEALTAPSKRTNGRVPTASKRPSTTKARKPADETHEAKAASQPVEAAVEEPTVDESIADRQAVGEPSASQSAAAEPIAEEAAAAEPIVDGAVEDHASPPVDADAKSGGAKDIESEAASGSRDSQVASSEVSEDVSRETLREVPGARFAELAIDSIHPNRKQPRTVFDEDEMAELVHSVREIGVLQPVVVRISPEGGEHSYELVMGERRWRASKEAGLDSVPAIIRDTTDDDLLRDALLENLHRSQLNPLEEAAAYQQLLEDFGCSQEELATRIGRSRPQISNTLRLMKLPPLVQRRLAAGVLSAGHARALLGLSDPAEMEKLAQRIVAEGLSVRSTEEAVAMSDGLRRPSKPSNPRAGERHERLDYIATSLSDRLDTNVKITLGAKKGRVSIEFASVDDLNRIMGVLSSTP